MILFLKTHVSGYVKKDGTVVAPHEDKRGRKSSSPDASKPANREPPKRAQKAWEMGLRHREKDISYHEMPDDELSFVGDNEMAYPVSRAFYESARRGAKKPKWSLGFRRGGIPEGGVSRNHVDDRDEIGVSMAKVPGVDYEWHPMGGRVNEELTQYEGWLLDPEEFWGSDGEPLMVGLKTASAGGDLKKSHPITQAATRSTAAPNLNEGDLRRNPGEPSAAQAESDRYKKPLLKWNGLRIRVENPAGSVRRGQDRAGKTWETRMVYDYGYVERSEGVDGDEVDVYVGPNPNAPMVYVVHQRKYGDWDAYDEDKVMLGFDSCDDACAAYLKHYDDPRFLGPVTEMPVAEFCAKVKATRAQPAMIKALARELGDFGDGPRVLFLKAHVKGHTRRLPSGKVVTVDPYDTKVQKRGDGTGQMDMFAPADEHGEVPPGKVLFTRKPGDKKPSKEEAMKEFVADSKAVKRPSGPWTVHGLTGDDSKMLSGLPEDARFASGNSRFTQNKWTVLIDGKMGSNWHDSKNEAAKEALDWQESRRASEKAKIEREERKTRLRERLAEGGEIYDHDLEWLGLRPGSAGLKWFIPAAADLFDISSRAVRPHIKGLIRVGHTDMGGKLESVPPKKALQAIAAGLVKAALRGTRKSAGS